jgi:hypothetical protein
MFWEGETRSTRGQDKELSPPRKDLMKLLITQPITKLPAFYGTQTFVNVFTGVLAPTLSQMNPVHIPYMAITFPLKFWT